MSLTNPMMGTAREICDYAEAARKRMAPEPACPIRPMEFYVVVQPDKPEEKTAGGIILPTSARDADELASDEGTLVAVSPLAFTYAEWPNEADKPRVGQRVVFKRYAGVLRKPKGGGDGLRILHDKDIMAVIVE